MTSEALSPDDKAHTLYKTQTFGYLGTTMPDGTPYVSLVQSAVGPTGGVVMFLSDLAQHTQNIKKNSHASVLIDGTDPQEHQRLAGARLTIIGSIAPDSSPEAADAFFTTHQDALGWRAFTDFQVYSLTPERGHMVGGFGQIDWLSPNQFMSFSER